MFKMINVCVLGLILMFVAACSEPQDQVTNVRWMGDGEMAVVNVRYANGNTESFSIRCKENNVRTPFSYIWEDDCDLNTELDGVVRDWDNPEDERFERWDDDDDDRYGNNDDEGFDLGDAAIGGIIGHSLSKKKKKKTVYTTPVKRPVVKRTVQRTSRPIKRSRPSRSSRRR